MAISLRIGTTQEQIDVLPHWRESSLFSEAEKIALEMADAMTSDSLQYTDEQMSRLRRFYSEGEIIELMPSAGLFNYFNPFNNMLQIEPTKPATDEELAEVGVVAANAQAITDTAIRRCHTL